MAGMKRFGEAIGKAQSNKHEYLTQSKPGKVNVRMVSGILPRYVYWVQNESLGIPATFDAFNFDRNREKFNRSLPDPVRDWDNGPGKPKGIVQFNSFAKKKEAIKARRNYLVWVLDRDDNNKLKLMELKASLYDSINEMMGQLAEDGMQSPLEIDLTISRKGTGIETVYSVEVLTASKTWAAAQQPDSEVAKRLEADTDILGEPIYDDGYLLGFEDVPRLDEVFPAPYDGVGSVDEAVEAYVKEIAEFLGKVKTDEDGSSNKHSDSSASTAQGATEAAADL